MTPVESSILQSRSQLPRSQNLLSENGDPITITINWAKSLLCRLNFVKRRDSSTAKISVTNFEELKEQYLFDIKAVTMMEEVPPELIINWDHTGISIVPGSAWTMEVKGSNHLARQNKCLPATLQVPRWLAYNRYT